MLFRIEQYRIFNIVANSKSFSKAAQTLFMTQSAVSQAIKQLEISLDMILFKRTAKGVELTEARKHFIQIYFFSDGAFRNWFNQIRGFKKS